MPPGLIIFLCFAGFAIALVVLSKRWEHKRRAAVRSAMVAAGLECSDKPSVDEQIAAFESIRVPPEWQRGPAGVRWCARGVVRGMPVTIFEHSYSTGSGKNRRHHLHTLATVKGVKGLPSLIARERHLGDSLAKLFGAGASVPTLDPDFDKAFRVLSDDPGAASLLTPGLRTWLMQQPGRDDSLITGPDSFAIVRAKRVPADQLAAFAAKPVEALAAMQRHT